MDVLTISWGWFGGKSPAEATEGSGMTSYPLRRVPIFREDMEDEEIIVLLMTEMLLHE